MRYELGIILLTLKVGGMNFARRPSLVTMQRVRMSSLRSEPRNCSPIPLGNLIPSIRVDDCTMTSSSKSCTTTGNRCIGAEGTLDADADTPGAGGCLPGAELTLNDERRFWRSSSSSLSLVRSITPSYCAGVGRVKLFRFLLFVQGASGG